MPPNVETRVPVLMGFTEAKVWIPPHCIFPNRTTERPGFHLPREVHPIISALGEHVVIIGADVSGNSDWIGEYRRVVQCEFLPPLHSASVQALTGPSTGQIKFFHENSLCHSYQAY